MANSSLVYNQIRNYESVQITLTSLKVRRAIKVLPVSATHYDYLSDKQMESLKATSHIVTEKIPFFVWHTLRSLQMGKRNAFLLQTLSTVLLLLH